MGLRMGLQEKNLVLPSSACSAFSNVWAHWALSLDRSVRNLFPHVTDEAVSLRICLEVTQLVGEPDPVPGIGSLHEMRMWFGVQLSS